MQIIRSWLLLPVFYFDFFFLTLSASLLYLIFIPLVDFLFFFNGIIQFSFNSFLFEVPFNFVFILYVVLSFSSVSVSIYQCHFLLRFCVCVCVHFCSYFWNLHLKVIIIYSDACLRVFNLVWSVMLLFPSAAFSLGGKYSLCHLKYFDPHILWLTLSQHSSSSVWQSVCACMCVHTQTHTQEERSVFLCDDSKSSWLRMIMENLEAWTSGLFLFVCLFVLTPFKGAKFFIL